MSLIWLSGFNARRPLMMLLLFLLKEVILKFFFCLFLVYEQRWCNKYNEKFKFKWRKWIIITAYYERHRKIILNRAKEYDENNQERSREQARSNWIIIWKRKVYKETI